MKLFKSKKTKVKDPEWKVFDEIVADINQNPLSASEKGAMHVGLASAYLISTNSVLENYKKYLEDTIASLEQLKLLEKDFEEKYSIAKVRVALKNS